MAKDKQFEVRDMRHKEKFFLDDQYLNGYAKICGVYATAVYISLCRHADKEQKCWPSHEKIAEEHAISSRQVIRALKILADRNIVRQERIGKKANNRYWLVDKSEWTNSQVTHDSDVTNSQFIGDCQSVHHVTNSQFHSKDTHIKETHSKDSNVSVAGINELIILFEKINPSYKRFYSNITERKALERMLREHGQEKLSKYIQAAVWAYGREFAPRITSPYTLERKIGDLGAYLKSERDKKSKGKEIIGL